jgi:hypothetical protein
MVVGSFRKPGGALRSHFPEYYRPSDDEFEALWSSCLFIFDTNVLLNLYRYKGATRNQYFDILAAIAKEGRLWIPHQVGLEYHERRPDVICEQESACQDLEQQLQEASRLVPTRLGLSEPQTTAVCGAINEAIKQVAKGRKSRVGYLIDDPIRERLSALLEGCVGEPYAPDALKALHKEAELRFARSVPPGYEDMKKGEIEVSDGDFILWRQTLDKAKSASVPIVLVTDDGKDDWWHRRAGKTMGPRPELIREMATEAQVPFYLYKPEQFLGFAAPRFGVRLRDEAVDDVKKVAQSRRFESEALHRNPLREWIAVVPDVPPHSRHYKVIGLVVGPRKVLFEEGTLVPTIAGWRLTVWGAQAPQLGPQRVGLRFQVQVDTGDRLVDGRATLVDSLERLDGSFDLQFISSVKQLKLGEDAPESPEEPSSR